MLKNKKVIISCTILLVVALGAWYTVNLVKNKMYSQIMTYVDTPEVKKQIEEAAKQVNENPELVNKMVAEADKMQVDKIAKSAAAEIQIPSKASAAELDKSSSTVQTSGTASGGAAGQNGSSVQAGKTSADSTSQDTNKAPENNNDKPASATNDKGVSPTSNGAPTAAAKPVFVNRAEAESFALSRFSASEITHYFAAYKNKDKLTRQEKDQIKKEILSRFTSQEIQAMLLASKK